MAAPTGLRATRTAERMVESFIFWLRWRMMIVCVGGNVQSFQELDFIFGMVKRKKT